MNKKIKGILAILFTTLSIFVLAGCGKSASASDKMTTVKIGIMGSDNRIWNTVDEKLQKQNIKIKLVEFSDYSQPNTALDQGQIDLNAFQTVYFMDNWNKTHHTNIVGIGDTAIAPMALYSKKITKLSELKEGDEIALPNDATNEGRALALLQSAGLIKLNKDVLPTKKSIIENKLNLKISELDAAQTARSLGDVTASVVNSGVASDAKLNPKKAVYVEKVSKASKPYVNVISANKKDKDNPVYKKVVKAYQSEEVAKLYHKYYGDSEVPAWNLKILK